MKFLDKIKITILSVLLLSGCDLNESDPSNFNTANFFSTPSQAEAQVNAIYESLYPMQTNNQSWLILELRTGASNSEFTSDFGFPSFQRVRRLTMSADFVSVEVLWDSHYEGIANANLAINNIPEVEMDESKKNRLLGEARFLRAYYYFNLVRIYGRVPLITEAVDLSSDNLRPERAPLDAIYDLIVEDLTAAESSGLPFNDGTGRVTLGAIKSLLAEVYLTMAGHPLQAGDEFYELARDKAEEVIDSQEFQLFASFEAFRNPSMDNTGEHIFAIQFLVNEIENNDLQSGMVPFDKDISIFDAEIGFSWVQEEFVESYEEGDIRADEQVFYYTSFTSAFDRNQIVNFDNYIPFKFFNEEAHLNTAASGLDWQIIRYADVLFDFAEASNEVSGPTPEAYEAINKIRRRANVPELSGLSKSEFREAIWTERWHETHYEGEIWFDMIRTRKAFDFINNEFNDYVGHTLPGGEILQERDLLFPIPTDELRNNDNLVQNPGF